MHIHTSVIVLIWMFGIFPAGAVGAMLQSDAKYGVLPIVALIVWTVLCACVGYYVHA